MGKYKIYSAIETDSHGQSRLLQTITADNMMFQGDAIVFCDNNRSAVGTDKVAVFPLSKVYVIVEKE